jgi:hypothetical protein
VIKDNRSITRYNRRDQPLIGNKEMGEPNTGAREQNHEQEEEK